MFHSELNQLNPSDVQLRHVEVAPLPRDVAGADETSVGPRGGRSGHLLCDGKTWLWYAMV